jgi:aspartate racemase
VVFFLVLLTYIHSLMKTLGLIGGTTWPSTVDYYKYLNQLTAERTGGEMYSRLILYSVNFVEFKALADASDWDGLASRLSEIARTLEKAGAEGLVLCANTTHIVAEKVQQNVNIPLLNIVDAVAREIESSRIGKVALLGTRFTMENDFYQNKLLTYGIETIVPGLHERNFIHDSIFEELVHEIYKDETKRRYLELMDGLNKRGADGIILGCTEIPLLIKQADSEIPLFDSTRIHAKYAVDFALSD